MISEDYNKEILRLFTEVLKYEQKLNNSGFILNAKESIVELERKKYTDTFQKIKQLINWSEKWFDWNVQYYRELKTNIEPFESQWFDYVYNPTITMTEYMETYINYIK